MLLIQTLPSPDPSVNRKFRAVELLRLDEALRLREFASQLVDLLEMAE
jgi:hypothetical protein